MGSRIEMVGFRWIQGIQDRDGRVQVDISDLGQRWQGLGRYVRLRQRWYRVQEDIWDLGYRWQGSGGCMGSRVLMVGFRWIYRIQGIDRVQVDILDIYGIQMVGFRWIYGIQGIDGRVQVDIQNLGYRQGSSRYKGYWVYRWQGSGGYIGSRIEMVVLIWTFNIQDRDDPERRAQIEDESIIQVRYVSI